MLGLKAERLTRGWRQEDLGYHARTSGYTPHSCRNHR
jgi:hypothetical protein